MPNLFDYLQWRGDLSLKNDKFNDIDALILSRLSYLPFDNIVSEKIEDGITLYEASKRLFENDDYKKNILWQGDEDLLKHTAVAPRFKDTQLSGYVNIIEPKEQMQFSALLIKLDENRYYVSFRGTDNTIVGWQEDFNMYYMFPLPSQEKSVEYLSNVTKRLDGTFILGGHSKGGNLAVYSAAYSDINTQNKIEEIYNHDGPGFDSEAINKQGFQAIKDKIHTFVPQSSIFGMMLEHEEDFTIVKSSQKGFLQHDIYSWEINRTTLIELNRLTNVSHFFDNTIKQFVSKMNIEQRKKFIEAIFSLLENIEDDTFDELVKNFRKSSGAILKSIKNMDAKTRKLILSTLIDFIKCAKNNFSDINPLRKENRKQKSK